MELVIIQSSDSEKKPFAVESGAYGIMWAVVVKNDKKALPTFNEMMEGLLCWYQAQCEGKMVNKNKQQRKMMAKNFRNSWDKIFKNANITKVNQKLEWNTKDEELEIFFPFFEKMKKSRVEELAKPLYNKIYIYCKRLISKIRFFVCEHTTHKNRMCEPERGG